MKKEILTELPKTFWVKVTEENVEALTEWRNGSLDVGQLTGMCEDLENNTISKQHNPIDLFETDTYSFGKEISFEDFQRFVFKIEPEPIKPEDLTSLVTLLEKINNT